MDSRSTSIDTDLYFYNKTYPSDISIGAIEMNKSFMDVQHTHTHRHSKTYSMSSDHNCNGYSSSSQSKASNQLHQTLQRTVQQSWEDQLSKSKNNQSDDSTADNNNMFNYIPSISIETPITITDRNNMNNMHEWNNNHKNTNYNHKKHKFRHRQNKSKNKNKNKNKKSQHMHMHIHPPLTPTDTELYGGPKPYFVQRKRTHTNPFSPNANANANAKPTCTNPFSPMNRARKSKDLKKGKHKKHKRTVDHYNNYYIVNDGDSSTCTSHQNYLSYNESVLF